MSYAIIRNTNYKMKNLAGIYRHNERKNANYSNQDINKEKSKENYSLKNPGTTYEKLFQQMKEKYNLKGQIKEVSNVACEYIITSDPEFFENIGKEETKRFFKTAYSFVANYKNLGEQYILSAKVHMDERTPHMHIVFLPVVHKKDKNGKEIDKIACSEFWKGKDSYKKLQDSFHQYMNENEFLLERGKETQREHLTVEELKTVSSYEKIKAETYHLQTNYMFEMANERKDMFIGDFRLKLDYSFHLQRSVLFSPINKTYTHSADLFVQAGEYQSIRNFNNGII